MQTIIVRTAADPGDTSYVDESVDWPREERRYINRLAEALDGAYPDYVIEVHADIHESVTVTDADGIPAEPGSEVGEDVLTIMGKVWETWAESLPARA